MAETEVSQKVLEAAREDLITQLHCDITDREREFLLSFKSKTPDWSLLDLDGIDKLPAIRWKLQNLERMKGSAHKEAIAKLEDVMSRNLP